MSMVKNELTTYPKATDTYVALSTKGRGGAERRRKTYAALDVLLKDEYVVLLQGGANDGYFKHAQEGKLHQKAATVAYLPEDADLRQPGIYRGADFIVLNRLSPDYFYAYTHALGNKKTLVKYNETSGGVYFLLSGEKVWRIFQEETLNA